VRAADGRFVAAEPVEVLPIALIDKREGTGVAAFCLGVFEDTLHVHFEGGGFDTARAEEAPFLFGELRDERVLVGAGGLPIAPEIFEESVEVIDVLARDDQVLRGEAVAERVEAGDGFAGFRSGSGGVERIGAAGDGLGGGRHDRVLLGEIRACRYEDFRGEERFVLRAKEK
jgi:hypothetical protein